MNKTTDWKDFTLRAIDLCLKYGIRHYVKKDLQGYLPDGYKNEIHPTFVRTP